MAKKGLWRSNNNDTTIRRHDLSSLLPLEVPISIDVEASSVCCLKCRYCPQSLDNNVKKSINIGNNGMMDLGLFREIVSQIKDFSRPLKNIRFAGFGEPLLNEHIVEMVEIIRESELAETITIFTNGIPLTKDLSDGLVNLVDTFLFDIQGIGTNDYNKWCGVNIDFERLVENIRYLYSIKKKGIVFIKTFKTLVRGKEEEFYKIFNDISDEIGIEDLYEIYPDIDYSELILSKKESAKYMINASKYCSYPWYQMAIDANGRVTACTLPVSKNSNFLFLGDVGKDRLFNMWNGKKMNEIRYQILTKRETIRECKNCKYTDLIPEEDRIDSIINELIEYCSAKCSN